METARELSVLLSGGSYFEAPRWHDGTWWVSDFYRRHVSRVTAAGDERVVTVVDQQPSGLGWLPNGCIWMADAFGGPVLRVAPGGEVLERVTPPSGQGAFACALGGGDGRTLLLCCAPDALGHNRAPVREAVLLTTTVDVPMAE
jgi:hypothetical protein